MGEDIEMDDLTAVINTDNMLEFYKKFDAIAFKYSLEEEKMQGDPKQEKRKWEYIEEYGKLEKLELDNQFTELTKVEYGDILTNLDMIYAGEEQSDQIIMLYDLVRNKIINQYINIDGLERMFSEKYIDFEWDMHLGIDYKKHKMNFYRDHFVHQIRNAYCMHILLEEFGFHKIIERTLRNQNNSKISQFVSKYVGKQRMRGYYNDKEEMEIYNTEDFYYKNVIYMASYMSALFHDIGYPEVSNTINQRRITEYIANLYNAETSGYNYLRLNALLQNSLLFRVVPFDEIQKRLTKDKPDHGALSAIVFLLNFYENGAIHGLPYYKKCAVELAALAIYNHTNHYCYDGKMEEGDYVRCVFTLNPISYLLRLCDDMQEWDRIYFELSNKSNLILCRTCKTPIIRKKRKGSSEKGIKYFYVYNCNYAAVKDKNGEKEISENGVFQPIFEYNRNFPYRRIFNISVCQNLMIEKIEDVLCFTLEYELDKLLHIAYLNPDYARYRIKELNQFKRLLDFQKELPQMKIRYFMTANPILIKTKIIDEYFSKNRDICSEMDALYYSYESAIQMKNDEMHFQEWERQYDEILELFVDLMEPVVRKVYQSEDKYVLITESVRKSTRLYLQLMIFMEIFQRCNQRNCSDKGLEKKAQIQWKGMGEQGRDFVELIEDCWKQFGRMYLDICKIKSNPINYYDQFKTSNYTYGCIFRFVSTNKYDPVLHESGTQIDAFTDLGLFQVLLESI